MEWIDRTKYPALDQICWHMGGSQRVLASEAFAIYERNWAYVDVRTLSKHEIQLITRLAHEYGNGVFAPSGGQPIVLAGVNCV